MPTHVDFDRLRDNWRFAYSRRATFGIGELPAFPAMTKLEAEQARRVAYDHACQSWRPDAREMCVAEVAAIDAAIARKMQTATQALRDWIMERDGPDCWLCGETMDDDCTVEHLNALALGGTNAVSNLALCHLNCNRLLGHLPLSVKQEMRAQRRAKIMERTAA